jgi:precorrin-6A/cobalt-precorrin-6A reductase
MHQGAARIGPAATIWLVAGTGDGPPLARALLQRGWRVVVSVVTPEAARAYPPDPLLTLLVGALGDASGVAERLDQLQPRWVVDATHPFAVQVSALLQAVCAARHQALLSLARPRAAATLPADEAFRMQVLPSLASLGDLDLRGERLLLAIGSRQLSLALALSGAAAHFARILDRPSSLQLALAAGIADGQLACLRPDPAGNGAVEQALCRRWRISAVLCRQSGGKAEGLWHALCADLGLRLLLIQQPQTGGPSRGLLQAALLARLGTP